MNTTIRQLETDDDRNSFDCGVESLNAWLKQMAGQNDRKRFTRTYVMVEADDPKKVIGYYSLMAISAETEGLPSKKRLPEKVSAVLLARLALDKNYTGQGLGESLLMHALYTTSQASNLIGVHCVIVDALNEDVANKFYMPYGFAPFQNEPLRLVFFLETLKDM
ncbi:GNAT family N-acetyltransferase [Paraburkholderia sp.]|uniref:GNAT family N-acetyltransferase n=1 Tax=Paraburkholderia sp. TaxID=1926495 RepID=UPI0025DE1983|nr:GNAT family N-acetyltransferase [Paraburkholderia sp.]